MDTSLVYFGESLWTPSNLSTAPVGWFDASDHSSLNLSAFSWANKGSKGGTASQNTVSAKPTYQATGFNNKPTLYFDGGDFLNISPLLYNDPDLVYIIGVAKLENAPTARILFGHRSGGTELIQLTYQTTTSAIFQLRSSANVIQQPTITFDPLSPHVIECQLNVPANSHYITSNTNNTATNTYNFGTTTFNSTVEYIGATNSGATNVYFGGWCSELILLDYIPSTTDREKLQGCLAHKWELSSILPSGHPYKNNPPYL